MHIICDISTKNIESYINNNADGFILSLKNYSIGTNNYFTLDEIKEIVNKYDKEFFININRNMLNTDIKELENILIELSKLNIKGIIYYDLAVLQIKIKNKLNINLVWNQEHMTTNYNTCNYYNDKGVKYVILSNEITKEEILEINKKSNIIPMIYIFGKNNVAHSKRKLVNNFYENFNLEKKPSLTIHEKISNQKYILNENKDGTTFILDEIINNTEIIEELSNNNFEYIIFNEYDINHNDYLELINDTKKYINNNYKDNNYLIKYKNKYNNNTGFLYKKSIYKVK